MDYAAPCFKKKHGKGVLPMAAVLEKINENVHDRKTVKN